jgi:hypothetical protein
MKFRALSAFSAILSYNVLALFVLNYQLNKIVAFVFGVLTLVLGVSRLENSFTCPNAATNNINGIGYVFGYSDKLDKS